MPIQNRGKTCSKPVSQRGACRAHDNGQLPKIWAEKQLPKGQQAVVRRKRCVHQSLAPTALHQVLTGGTISGASSMLLLPILVAMLCSLFEPSQCNVCRENLLHYLR